MRPHTIADATAHHRRCDVTDQRMREESLRSMRQSDDRARALKLTYEREVIDQGSLESSHYRELVIRRTEPIATPTATIGGTGRRWLTNTTPTSHR